MKIFDNHWNKLLQQKNLKLPLFISNLTEKPCPTLLKTDAIVFQHSVIGQRELEVRLGHASFGLGSATETCQNEQANV